MHSRILKVFWYINTRETTNHPRIAARENVGTTPRKTKDAYGTRYFGGTKPMERIIPRTIAAPDWFAFIYKPAERPGFENSWRGGTKENGWVISYKLFTTARRTQSSIVQRPISMDRGSSKNIKNMLITKKTAATRLLNILRMSSD
ncbi:MAG: hypothetical protein E4H15_04810 [Syntrophobacterales bacterium]|nr:MAG: hypothetical protein E4H15_04810 [Syntrophobacterales bacterium]